MCAAPRDLSQSCMSPTHGHEPLAALMASCPQPPPGERRGPSRREGSEQAAWSSTRLLPGAGRDVRARPVTEARLWVLQEQEETSALLSCAPTYMGTTGVGGHARVASSQREVPREVACKGWVCAGRGAGCLAAANHRCYLPSSC